MRRQRDRVLSAAAALRLGGALVLLALSLALWRVQGDEDWSAQVPTLIAYATLALVTFREQGRTVMVRLAWVQPLLDVGFAYALLRTSVLLGGGSVEAMAGLSVAVLLLPVALTGLAFRAGPLIMVTACAAIANLSLMSQAGLSAWPMITATAIVMLVASGSRQARETVEAEITRRLLAETSTQCEALSRLQQEKDSLLGIIVHDMRALVSTTMLSLEYLREQTSHRKVAAAWSETIADALVTSSDLSDMIAQILDTRKLEAGSMTLQPTVVDACQLLEKARDHTLTHARSKSIALTIDAEGPIPIVVDPWLLLRTFESLVTCSIRQTPTGGQILLQASQDGREARIAVHRSGPPIPADQREAIFERFQPSERARPRLAGQGLGLYFCWLAAEASRAKLTLESTEGWSSSFVVRLSLLSASLGVAAPFDADPTQHPPTASSSAAASALMSARRASPSPRSRVALAEFERTMADLDRDLEKTT